MNRLLLNRVFGGKTQAIRSTRKVSRQVFIGIEELEMRALLTGLGPIILPHPPPIPSNPVADGNFIAPALAYGAYQYDPAGTAWSYYSTSGVSSNGSGFTAGNPNCPSGTRVAFIQRQGTIEQTVDLDAGTYSLSMLAAQRAAPVPAAGRQPWYQTSFQALAILVDSQQVGVIVPSCTSYDLYQTPNFTIATSGSHLLIVQGLDPMGGDNTAFITEVGITSPITGTPSGESAVLANAMFSVSRDGAISFHDMLTVLNSAAANGGITPSDMQSLQTILADRYFLMSPAVSDLAGKVVNGDPANATYQYLDHNGNVVVTPLGNLTVGSSMFQLDELINKWFLGVNYPSATDSKHPSDSYSAASGTVLFGSGGPAYTDIFQGDLGDCTVLASLAEVAARDNSAIQSMFTFVGTNSVNGTRVDVWAVRFYDNNLAPTYVTVDSELPAGGKRYDQPAGGTVLWAALAEKAYAELNQSGRIYTLHEGQNSYAALANGNVGTARAALSAFTGLSTDYYDINDANPGPAMQAGKLVVMCTGNSVADPTLFEHNHCYAIVDYDPSTGVFTLFNPWGVNGGRDADGQFEPGTVECHAAVLGANFADSVQAGSQADSATDLIGALLSHAHRPVSTPSLPEQQAAAFNKEQWHEAVSAVHMRDHQGTFAETPVDEQLGQGLPSGLALTHNG